MKHTLTIIVGIVLVFFTSLSFAQKLTAVHGSPIVQREHLVSAELQKDGLLLQVQRTFQNTGLATDHIKFEFPLHGWITKLKVLDGKRWVSAKMLDSERAYDLFTKGKSNKSAHHDYSLCFFVDDAYAYLDISPVKAGEKVTIRYEIERRLDDPEDFSFPLNLDENEKTLSYTRIKTNVDSIYRGIYQEKNRYYDHVLGKCGNISAKCFNYVFRAKKSDIKKTFETFPLLEKVENESWNYEILDPSGVHFSENIEYVSKTPKKEVGLRAPFRPGYWRVRVWKDSDFNLLRFPGRKNRTYGTLGKSSEVGAKQKLSNLVVVAATQLSEPPQNPSLYFWLDGELGKKQLEVQTKIIKSITNHTQSKNVNLLVYNRTSDLGNWKGNFPRSWNVVATATISEAAIKSVRMKTRSEKYIYAFISEKPKGLNMISLKKTLRRLKAKDVFHRLDIRIDGAGEEDDEIITYGNIFIKEESPMSKMCNAHHGTNTSFFYRYEDDEQNERDTLFYIRPTRIDHLKIDGERRDIRFLSEGHVFYDSFFDLKKNEIVVSGKLWAKPFKLTIKVSKRANIWVARESYEDGFNRETLSKKIHALSSYYSFVIKGRVSESSME